MCKTVSTNYISIFHATRSTDICTVGPVLLVPSRILSQQRLIHRSYFRIDCKTCMDTLLRWPGRDVDFFFIRDFLFSNRDCFFQPRLSFSSATLFFHPRLLFFIRNFFFHPQLFLSACVKGEDRWFHGHRGPTSFPGPFPSSQGKGPWNEVGRRHLGCGANTAKFTVKIGRNRDFDAR